MIFYPKLIGGLLTTLVLMSHSARAAVYPPDSIRVTVTEGTNLAAALSPDKKTIAFDWQGTIWVLPATGGRARPITDAFGDSRQPAWSPDGQYIAYHAFYEGNYHIYTVRADGSQRQQRTRGLSDNREPHWSPDGKSLIFASDRSKNYDIWQLTLSSGTLTQLTTDPANQYNPAFGPDGQQIAFVSEKTDAPGLYIRDGMGNENRVVATTSKLAAPAWSPDGRQLLYNTFTRSRSGLDAVVLATGEVRQLTTDQDDVFPFRVSWFSASDYLLTVNGQLRRASLTHPASQLIPFSTTVTLAKRSYARKTYRFDDPGPQPVRGIKGPCVSPDGRQVAFAALGDIWLLTKGNPNPRQLTDDAFAETDPTFSPDGTQLAYLSDRNGNMDVWIRNLLTGDERCLVDLADELHFLSWSPDGSRLAFYQADARNAWGRSTLLMADVKTGTVEKKHESLFVPSQPTWSPDGKTVAMSALQIYSSRYREGISEILLVSLDGQPDRSVSPEPGRTLGTRSKNGPVWSPDGSMMAYIQDGLLWVIATDAAGNLTGRPRALTTELAEAPTWTGDSKAIVFLATDVLKQVSLADGRSQTIPLDLTYHLPQSTEKLVVHAGRLFNGRSATYQTNVDILIEGNRIRAIEPHRPGRAGQLIDASDKTVMPGLFECHTHQHALSGEQLGRLWLSFGITSLREPGADPYDALERKESWITNRRPGPRQFFTGGLTDGRRIYYGAAVSVLTPEHLDRELNRALRLDYDMLKTYVRLPDAMQQRITSFAHAHGIPVSSHEIYPAMSYAVDAVEHIGGTSRRGYSPKITAMNNTYQDVIQLLAASQMNITPTASLQGGFNVMAARDTNFFQNRQFKTFYSEAYTNRLLAESAQLSKLYPGYIENFGNLQKTLKALVLAGAHVTTGTDSPFVPYGLSLHTELQSFVGSGLSPYQALRSATLWAAEAVGVAKDLGSIEAGKLADLVIVTGDPLTRIEDARNVDVVVKDGKPYSIEQLLTRPTVRR